MRLCSGAGCGRAVPDDVRYCAACKPIIVQSDIREHTGGYDAILDALRKSTRWQRLRDRVVRAQPMCKCCHRRRTEIVDHIVPAQIAVMQAQLSGKYLDKWAGYFLRSNLQGLCRLCHYRKTLEDKTHAGDWPDVVAKEQAQSHQAVSF